MKIFFLLSALVALALASPFPRKLNWGDWSEEPQPDDIFPPGVDYYPPYDRTIKHLFPRKLNWGDWSEEPQPDDIFPPGLDYYPPADDSFEPSSRIVGGIIAKKNSFPYQVGLLLTVPQGQSWCGGSMISNQYIITAAHCVDSVYQVTVFLGAHDITNPNEPGTLKINVNPRNIIVHSGWNPNVVKDDIALIKLPSPVKLNDKIQTIRLPRSGQKFQTFAGETVTASGWGRYSDDEDTAGSPVLRYVDVQVMQQSRCRNYFPYILRDSNICVDGSRGKSACNGDSGGPLVIKESDGVRTLIGLTSFGSSSGCEKGWPGVFTRVTSYLDWISSKTGIKIQH